MDHGEVERSKVFVEGEIDQIIIYVEEECVSVVLRGTTIRDPVQLVSDDFNGFTEDLGLVHTLMRAYLIVTRFWVGLLEGRGSSIHSLVAVPLLTTICFSR